MVDALLFLAGAALLGVVLWDIFQTIVVPRPTPGRVRLGRYVIPPAWRIWRWLGTRARTATRRDWFLGQFAPGAAVMLLALWIAVIVVAYGLMLYALRAEIVPAPTSLLEAIYFAGTSALTIGYGDVVATGGASRIIVLVSAATGLGVVALVITFLFSLFGSYQRREIQVVTLSARAKSPPSAVALLETYARLDLVDELPVLLRDWELWSAEVLDSHVAYPLLAYFRSSHDDISWISTLGAVLDTAALVITTLGDVPRGQAEITLRLGSHLVEDIANYLGQEGAPTAFDPADFATAYARLEAGGYALEPRERASRAFERVRGTYAPRLQALAAYLATPAPDWGGGPDQGRGPGHAPVPPP